jgi:hypothetical protein
MDGIIVIWLFLGLATLALAVGVVFTFRREDDTREKPLPTVAPGGLQFVHATDTRDIVKHRIDDAYNPVASAEKLDTATRVARIRRTVAANCTVERSVPPTIVPQPAKPETIDPQQPVPTMEQRKARLARFAKEYASS